jgi:hypothetical protein
MPKITRIETIYPALTDDGDYYPDGESSTAEENVTFRELVALMREHPNPSSSRLTGSQWEWLSAEPYQDPYTGEFIEHSLHYGRDNPPHMLRYWRLAMLAAGHRVGG